MATTNITPNLLIHASDVHVGMYVILKQKPCKVIELTRSKAGKHGTSKIYILGIDIITRSNVEEIFNTEHNVEVLSIQFYDLTLVEITMDGYVVLLVDDLSDSTKEVMVFDDNERVKIRKMIDEGKQVKVHILSTMGIDIYESCFEDLFSSVAD
eukprot:TRINITY_DN4248_c0_g1_i1.p1 TRINITY_DN4248_c0_g1~~TRINITY_DN4248_c0_g1_i1.p1  ORF type:complete len:154 (+),score=20.11 TRINITY_DN4248_c0_g1_i1:393-854(+)